MHMLTTILTWVLRLALFGVCFVFALQNRHAVQVNGWFGSSANTSVVVALGCATLFGILLGIAITLPRLLRYRQQRNGYRNRVESNSPKHMGQQHNSATSSTNTVYGN